MRAAVKDERGFRATVPVSFGDGCRKHEGWAAGLLGCWVELGLDVCMLRGYVCSVLRVCLSVDSGSGSEILFRRAAQGYDGGGSCSVRTAIVSRTTEHE
jgi:hypothetical protein